MIEEIQRRVEEKMSKLLRIKKLKKKVIKFKKRCKKYKKLIRGLQEQLSAKPEKVSVEVVKGLDLFNTLEFSMVNSGDVYSGAMCLNLKKKELSALKLGNVNSFIVKMSTSDNPLSLILQAETLAEHLGVKLIIRDFTYGDMIMGTGEKTIDSNITKKEVKQDNTPKMVIPPSTKEKITNETPANITQSSSPAVPIKEKAPQQNPK